MGIENIFIASAIQTCAVTGVFLYLHHMAESNQWKIVYLIGVFLSLLYGIGIERVGFENFVVSTELANLSFIMLEGVMWFVVCLILYLLLMFAMSMFKAVSNFFSGRSEYGKTEAHDEGR